MAIRDLLWTCPECGTESGLKKENRGETCVVCGTRFRRGAGSSIEAHRRDGRVVVRAAVEWLAWLPPLPGEASWTGEGPLAPRSARADLRLAAAEMDVRRGGELLGRIERLGEAVPGTATLDAHTLRFQSTDGRTSHEWPLESLTALQGSSGSLQLKARGRPVASLRLHADSVRLWEALLEEALRRRFRALGWGEIVEFQPRIVTR